MESKTPRDERHSESKTLLCARFPEDFEMRMLCKLCCYNSVPRKGTVKRDKMEKKKIKLRSSILKELDTLEMTLGRVCC